MYRIKDIWEFAPLPAKAKLVWTRLTCNKLVLFYFAFTVIHCFLQVTFQFSAHTINFRAGDFLAQVVSAAKLETKNFTLYHEGDQTLRSCWGIPKNKDDPLCRVIWMGNPLPLELNSPENTASPSIVPSTSTVAPTASVTASPLDTTQSANASQPTNGTPLRQPNETVIFETFTSTVVITESAATPTFTRRPTVRPKARRSPHAFRKRNVFISPITGGDTANSVNSTITGLRIGGLGDKGTASFQDHDAEAVEISLQCAAVVRWPLQSLRNAKREDLVFVGFQIWVFGVGVVALLNESIPHVIAAFLTHILATIWSCFQLAHTATFQKHFVTLTVNGACKGVNLLPGYWKDRSAAEIPVLVLNCIGLLLSGFLSWRLIKSFGWATFKRVGADLRVNRIYMLVLSMSIVLQLSLFFIVTSMALWIDQLYNGSIGVFAKHGTAYRVIDVLLFLLLLPWLGLGWFAVRKEHTKMMYGFFGLSILFMIEWASMFASDTWRLTFLNWVFFATMSVAAAVFTVLVIILGVFCQRNFGVGLANYLKPPEDLRGEDFQKITDTKDLERFVDIKDEKVLFPSQRLPTYSDAYPTPPREAQTVPPRWEGTRGVTRTGGPDATTYPATVRQSVLAPTHFVALPSNPRDTTLLTRSDSRGSTKSYLSSDSKHSDLSDSSGLSGNSTRKRWVIE